MKKLTLFSLLLCLSVSGIFAQGNTCAQATPFCEAPGGAGVTFPNSTSTTAPLGPSYGCLSTQPNPAYFFIKTSAAGNMVYNISQTNLSGTGIDVDFIAWGPFSTYSSMCNNLTGSCSPGGTALPQTCTGNIEDCSYSTSATEVMTLASPGAGYYYLIMITNYNGAAGNITFSQTSGPASDCSITCPSTLSGDGILLTDGVSQLPATVSCGTAPFGIMASPNSAFGSPIVPGVLVSFLNNTNASNQITWYEDGSALGCFGPAASCGGSYTLTPNTNTDLQFSYSSPSAATTFTLCENNTAQPNMNYTVTNLATHAVITTGTWLDDGSCQSITLPAGSITGVATFTADCGACITATDYGYALFNPSAASVGTHTITYTFAPGGSCAPYVFTKTITVVAPTVTAVASPTTICQGSSSTLTASGTPSTTNVSFSNTTGYTISASGTPTVTAPITVSGLAGTVGTSLVSVNINIDHTYDQDLTIKLQCPNGTIINLSAANGFSGDNYTNTTFATGGTPITSGSPPFTGTFAPQQPFSGLSGCNENGTWNLIVTDGTTGFGGYLYNWTITFLNQNTYTWAPAGSLSASTGTSVVATPTVTTTYTVTATDATGCPKTNTVTVNVNPTPVMTSSSTGSACSGTALNIPLTSSGSGSTYTWLTTDNVNTTGESTTTQTTGTINNTITNNTASAQTLTYTVTPTATSGGCVGTAQQVTVTINPRPTISVNSPTICSGQSTTLTATGTSNTYVWSTTATTNTVSVAPTNTVTPTTYTVTGTVTGTGCTNSATATVTVNPTPTVTVNSPTTCSGVPVTLTAAGATTYTWSTTATTNTISVAPVSNPTTYTVTGSSAAGCAGSPIISTVTVNSLPAAPTAASMSVCPNATATLTATAPGPTYNWFNVSSGGSSLQTGASYTTPAISSPTTYYVQTTDVNGCTSPRTSVAVGVYTLPSIGATGGMSPTACSGGSVAITFTTNPSSGVTINWTTVNGSNVGIAASGTNSISYTAPVVAATATASISATVTNNTTGCSSPASAATGTITVNPKPVVNVSSVTVCDGQPASITASGGSPAANSYSWNTGASGATLSFGSVTTGGTPTTYTYAATGTITATGCTGTGTGSITVNPRPNVAANSPTTCSGVPVTLTATGATTYTWSTSATTNTISVSPTSLTPTTVQYTVTGTNGATTCTNVYTATVTVNPLPTITSTVSAAQTVCAEGNVPAISFNTNPAGASVNWTTNSGAGLPASGTNTIPGYVAPNVMSQATGTYTVVATNTVTGCSNAVSPLTGTITVNPNPVINAGITIAPSNCGASTGSITGVSASGAPSISYAWSSGQSTANITNVPAGSYNLVVTDGNGCTADSAFSISNPGAPQNPTVSVNNSPNAAICEGGSATFNIVGPAGGTVYNWFGPGGASLGSGTSITVNNATLADGGNYTASATAAGCTGAQSDTAAVLVVNPNPVPQVTPTGTNSFCSDATYVLSASASNPGGSATIPANGYQWTLGGTPIPGATAITYTTSTPGTYGLSITNSNGCSATASTNVTLNNFSEPVLGTPTSVVNSNCTSATGVVSGISTTGGTATYTYTWYNASSAVISTSTTTSDLDSTAAGTYTLIVVDGNGCNDTISAVILNDNAPGAPAVSGTNNPNCSGSANNPITMTNTGGTITWYSDPALTNVLALDTITYQPVNTVTDTLYVTETSNGCQSASTQVIVTINQTPAAPVASNVSICQGGIVPDLTATVNVGTINWYSDAGMTNPPLATGSPFASGATTTTTYYAAATNLNCTGPVTPVTVFINSPPTINVTNLTVDSASCGGASDGGINGITVGGTPSFTYVWSNASGVVSTSTSTPNLSNEPAGTYTLTVTDGNTCVASYGPAILSTTTVPPVPVFVTSSDTVYCAGDAVTALSVNAGSSIVSWYSDAGLTNLLGIGTSYTPTGITTNTTIYVTATSNVNNSCVSSPLPVTLTFNPLPTVGGNSPTVCAGGSVTLNGTGAASYAWSGGISNGVAFAPGATTNYVVTGTNVNGCVNTATVTVTVNNLPNVGATQGSSALACSGQPFTLNGTGATSYSWNNGVTDGVSFVPAASGNYIVTGTDGNGCTNTFTVAVTVNALPVVSAGAAATDTMPCGSTSFNLPAATTNAASPSYVWSGPAVVSGGTTAAPVIGGPGSYTVVVTDGATGCSAQSSITIINNSVVANFTPDVTSGFNPLAVNFTNTSVGATTYAWSFGDGNSAITTNASNTFTTMGTYQVVLTASSNGCVDTAMVTIIVNENSSITIPNIFSPNGDDVNDFLTIVSTGIEEMNIDIFNRWGQKVYTITAPGQSWDGKLANGETASEGTYFYLLKAVGYDKKEYEKQGPVMLVK